MTLTMVSIMLTTIRLPFDSAPDMGEDPHPPKTLTAYHTPFSIENGLFTSKTGKHDAYQRLPTLSMKQWPRQGGVPPPLQNAYRLPNSIFNVFSSKTGKYDAYQTLTDAYNEGVPTPLQNAYRLPYIIFNVFSSTTGKPTLIKRLPTLIMRQWPHPLPKTLTAYHTVFSMYLALKQVSPRLPNAYRRLPSGNGPTPSQKRLPLTIQYFQCI